MRRIVNQSSIKFFLALVCLLFAFSSIAHAQSGRKTPKQTPSPPVPAPATAAPPANNSQPLQLPLIVTRYVAGINISFQTRIAQDAVLERLQKSQSVTARGGGEMNRAEARKRAQADTKSYVIWLWLEPDMADIGRAQAGIGRVNSRSLVLSYIVFTPGTGKIKTQGRVYQRTGQITMSGGGVLGIPTGRLPSEFLLREAGREAADRILTELDVAILN